MEKIKTLYEKTEELVGKEVVVEGWVKTVRDSKTFGFIELNDGSFFKNVQVVFDDSLSNFAEICKLPISSSIKVTGKLVKQKEQNNHLKLKLQELK